MVSKNPTNKLEILLQVFVVIVIFLALFFDGKGINFVSEWFTKIFISLVYSMVAGGLVGTFTGNLFENLGNLEITESIKINWPTILLTFLVKIWLF